MVALWSIRGAPVSWQEIEHSGTFRLGDGAVIGRAVLRWPQAANRAAPRNGDSECLQSKLEIRM